MKVICFAAIFILAGVFSAVAPNELIDKYRHRYSALEEADVDSVVALISSPDTVIAREATVLIHTAFRKGFAAARKSVPVLLDLAKASPSWRVRGGAVAALAASHDPAANEVLLEIAEDEGSDPLFRMSALKGLYGLGVETDKVMRIASQNLRAANLDLRIRAMLILPNSDDIGDLNTFIRAYVNHYEDPEPSLMAMTLVPNELKLKNAYEEVTLMFELGLSGIAGTRPELLEPIIMHPDSRIRLGVAKALEPHFDGRALTAISEVLATDPDWQLRFKAAEILGSSSGYARDRTDSVVAALKHALQDPYIVQLPEGLHRPVAAKAYQGLEKFGIQVERPGDCIWPDDRSECPSCSREARGAANCQSTGSSPAFPNLTHIGLSFLSLRLTLSILL